MPPAYIIADVNITDEVQYAEYRKLSKVASDKYGAEACVRGGATEMLEGGWQPGRMVVLKFPSMADARQFYESPEYSLARAARSGAAVMRMIIVEGTA